MTDLSDPQKRLLKWLSEADSSPFGECRSTLLDSLIERGLAAVLHPERGDKARVRLTQAGWEALK